MPITADCHLHSSFSGDSHMPMEEMVLQGIAQGLETMCWFCQRSFFQAGLSIGLELNRL